MLQHTFDVEGMDCEHCVAAVDKSVRELDGINEVAVSLESNSMVVGFDEALVSVQAIIDAVVEAGYEAALAV